MKKISVKIMMILLAVLLANFAQAAPIIKVSLLNQEPDPAIAGGEVELRFKIENFGDSSASGFELNIEPSYPFTKLPGETYKMQRAALSAFENGENAVTAKYRLKVEPGAVEGDIKIKAIYKSSAGQSTEEFDVSISSKDKIEISKVSKTQLEPGKETEIVFTLTNIGATLLKNIAFSWSEENNLILPVGSDNTKYINSLDIGESRELKYRIVAGTTLTAGLYALNTKIQYQDKSSTETVESNVGIVVGGETDFDVTFSESSAGQTSLSVANVGSNPALSVTVKVPEQENFRIQGSSASIVGNLDTGDYTIVSFQIASRAENSRTGTSSRQAAVLINEMRQNGSRNELTVLIEYTDTTGTRRSLEKHLPIQFRQPTGSDIGAQTGNFGRAAQQQSILGDKRVSIPLLILIIAICGYIYYRRKDYAAIFARKR